jgi:hypothetical protein
VVRPWLDANTWEIRVERFSELAGQAQLKHHDFRGLKSLLALPRSNGVPDGSARPEKSLHR